MTQQQVDPRYVQQQKMNSEEADPHFTCCCGPCRMHVVQGAFVIAIIGCVSAGIGMLSIISYAIAYGDMKIGAGVFMQMPGAALYILIIVAQKKRNYKYYLPYLIVGAIGLVGCILTFLAYVGIAIFAAAIIINNISFLRGIDSSIIILTIVLIGVFFALGIAVSGWFYSIVYRAYKYEKNEQMMQYGIEGSQVPPPSGQQMQGGWQAQQQVEVGMSVPPEHHQEVHGGRRGWSVPQTAPPEHHHEVHGGRRGWSVPQTA